MWYQNYGSMEEGIFMAKWILGADLLNKSALCKKTEIDPSNFNKFLAKGEVPKQHIEKIKAEIVKFGYVPPEIQVQEALEILTNSYLEEVEKSRFHQFPLIQDTIPQKVKALKITNRFFKTDQPEKEEVPPAAAPKYDFTGEKFLIIEKYTQYPLSQKPVNPVEAKIWLAKKKTADQEIKDAWDKKNSI